MTLVGHLRREIHRVVAPLFTPGEACALIDFPVAANAGDSAVWLGVRATLARLGVRVVYASDIAGFDRATMAARLGGGTIVFTGGGNLGDVWPRHQAFREAVVGAFPRNRIVQMPQHVWFRDPEHLARAREVFNAHRDLIVLVRDARSEALCRQALATDVRLCPDMALALGDVPRARAATRSIVWLARTDRETAWPNLRAAVGAHRRVDWRDGPDSSVVRLLGALVTAAGRWGRASPGRGRLWLYDALARRRVAHGVAMLSAGSVVVTDRFHAFILCLLLGIPHVLVDTQFGKLRAFYETWVQRCDLTHWAASHDEALRVAERLRTT
ncbi:MAG: polysaccharide pyruvyl transferase family protein [Armatimonadota bacterium]|nr:polysaccharide pyruvyl transferase family protein [Armatimonadota bacterium]